MKFEIETDWFSDPEDEHRKLYRISGYYSHGDRMWPVNPDRWEESQGPSVEIVEIYDIEDQKRVSIDTVSDHDYYAMCDFVARKLRLPEIPDTYDM